MIPPLVQAHLRQLALTYQPIDEMSLWWLAQSDAPTLVGRLEFISTLRGVGLRYAANWLRHGFGLSEDLPLRDHSFLPIAKDSAVGAVDDARPDRWGERMIRTFDRPARLSLMEYLYFAGNDRFGALGVSRSLQPLIYFRQDRHSVFNKCVLAHRVRSQP